MAQTRIFKIDETPTRQREGIVSMPLVNKDSCGARITTGTVTFPVGRQVEMHKHNRNEMVMVLAGDCEVEIEGVRTALKPFDTVHVEAGRWHRFGNTGTTPFTILWVYDDEVVERIFKETGESVPH